MSKITLWETRDMNDAMSKLTEYVDRITKTLVQTKRGTWFIKQVGDNGTYYQFLSLKGLDVTLLRKGKESVVSIYEFVAKFKAANHSQVKQHEEYLMSQVTKVAELNDYFDNHVSLKSEIARFLGVAQCPKTLHPSSVSFMNLTRKGYHHFYDIKEGGIDFIPMYVKPKPVKDASGSMSTPANSHSKGFDPKNCEFYMVTCRGNYGAKIRHTDYQEAVDEAQRIATRENHPCWVVGVVTKVNP